MKTYTFFTDTHKVFLKHFTDSFPFEEGFDLEVRYFSQDCPTGSFSSTGWEKTMKKKIEYILYSLEQTEKNQIFVHSDIDVQFFSNLKKEIEEFFLDEELDLLFQRDDFRNGASICMGFFICRSNENTKNFFKYIYDNLHFFKNDQIAVNQLINKFPLKYGLLPEKYYTVGLKNGLWSGNENILIPNDIIVHHANFTVGIENKIKLLELVKKKVSNDIRRTY